MTKRKSSTKQEETQENKNPHLKGQELDTAISFLSDFGFPMANPKYDTLYQKDIEENPELIKGLTEEEVKKEEEEETYITPEYIYIKTDKRFKADDGNWYNVLKINEPRFKDFPKEFSLTSFDTDPYGSIVKILPKLCLPQINSANLESIPLIQLSRITDKVYHAFFLDYIRVKNLELAEEFEKQREKIT